MHLPYGLHELESTGQWRHRAKRERECGKKEGTEQRTRGGNRPGVATTRHVTRTTGLSLGTGPHLDRAMDRRPSSCDTRVDTLAPNIDIIFIIIFIYCIFMLHSWRIWRNILPQICSSFWRSTHEWMKETWAEVNQTRGRWIKTEIQQFNFSESFCIHR